MRVQNGPWRARLWIAFTVLAALPAAARTAERELTNSVGIQLVLIPAGEFLMGGHESAEELVRSFPGYNRPPEYFSDEYPQHRVRITKPFYLGKFEVTVGQFRRFVKDTGSRTAAEADREGGWGYNAQTGKCEGRRPEYNWRNPGFPQSDVHPVVNVSWDDAVAFCQWLSRQEHCTYRLPTEAEWEYACRAGTATRYYNGNDPAGLSKVAHAFAAQGKDFEHVDEMLIPHPDARSFTVPVGGLQPNRFGLYDMLGNAWEWCADRYGEDYYAASPQADPTGPREGKLRVRRGGGWNSFPLWSRASFRNWNEADSRCVNLGFRVARDGELGPE